MPRHYLNINVFMAYRPKIGITMRLEHATRRFYLGRDYSEALAGSGATPVHIPLIPDAAFIEDAVAGLDGILLPGSDSDVDPAHFGEEPHPMLGRVVPEKDATDLMVLVEAEKRKIPLLAICFGLQALNVSRGGTIIQDIDSQVENPIKHQQGIPLERRSHSIRIKSGSLLEIALGVGTETIKVNSHHHQAISKIGKDLEEIAWASDGIIEAVKDARSDRFVVGVQWHPELDWENDPLSRHLFGEFVRSAANGRF